MLWVLTTVVAMIFGPTQPPMWFEQMISKWSGWGWEIIPLILFAGAISLVLSRLTSVAEKEIRRRTADQPKNKFKELYEVMDWCLDKMEELPPGTTSYDDLLGSSLRLSREVGIEAGKTLSRILNKLAVLAEDLKMLGLKPPPCDSMNIHPMWLGYLRKMAPLAKHGKLDEAKE